MISNSIKCIICFISYHLSLSNIHNARFLHSNYNLQMFNNSHLINHQLFFGIICHARQIFGIIWFPTSYYFWRVTSNPQIIVFLSSYIFFHSCKHTSASDHIWIYYHLTFWYLPTKINTKDFIPSFNFMKFKLFCAWLKFTTIPLLK